MDSTDSKSSSITVRAVHDALKSYHFDASQSHSSLDGVFLRMSRSYDAYHYFTVDIYAESAHAPVTRIDYSVEYENDYLGVTLCSVADKSVRNEDIEDINYFISIVSSVSASSLPKSLIYYGKRLGYAVVKPFEYKPVLKGSEVRVGSTYFVAGRNGMLPVRVTARFKNDTVEVDLPAEKLYLEMYDDDSAEGDKSPGRISVFELFTKLT